MGPLYSLEFVLLIVSVVFYYKAAALDDAPQWLWMGLSAGVYFLTWRVRGWQWLGCLFGQGMLFIGIALFRLGRESVERRCK